MNWKIPLSDIDFGPEEESAVLRVLRSRWLSMGAETAAFEAEFAEHLGVRHAIACANGTAALHLAFAALEIGDGDGVIQPALNFVSAANMTLATGATPLFADICGLEEPTISPEAIERIVKKNASGSTHSGSRPKAVVVMHYGGYPCRMNEIATLCDKYGMHLIEDACHAVGACFSSPNLDDPPRYLGGIGDVGCFSFFSNKNLVTGEGGMVTTQNDALAARVRALRSHGMTTLTWERHRGHASSYDVTCHGFNYRIDEIRSALGREQLKKLSRNNARRAQSTLDYWKTTEALEKNGWIIPYKQQFQEKLLKGVAFRPPRTACHLMPVLAPDEAIRHRAADALKMAGIQTSLHYPYIPEFSAFSAIGALTPVLPFSRQFCRRVITLPLYPDLNMQQIQTITDVLANVE